MLVPTSNSRWNAPWFVTLVVASGYLVFLVLRLAQYHADVTRFIVVGAHYATPRALPVTAYVDPGDGYDGQFYFRLAITPFISDATAGGITLDNPPYRAQRILYPLIVWGLSAGRPQLVPLLLILVNYAGLCGLGWAAGRYAQLRQQPAILGLAAPLYPGFLLAFARDTSEILACCWLCWGMVALLCRHPIRSGLLFLAAALTKETTVLLAASCALNSVIVMLRLARPCVVTRQHSLAIGIVVLGGMLLWQALLWWCWRVWPVQAGGYNLAYPFQGMAAFLADLRPFRWYPHRLWLAEWLLLLLFVLVVLKQLHEAQLERDIKLAFVLYLSLTILLGRAVWVDDWAFLRATAELYLVGLMILLATSRWWSRAVGLGTASLWIYLVYDMLTAR